MPQVFLKTKRSAFVYEPLGVIGVISPWNYPWSIPLGEVALALMAGNGVVLKPASLTPLIGERIADVFARAGVPEGLVRVVHGAGHRAPRWPSRAWPRCSSPARSRPGARSAEACARRLKGSVLELGGKDPMIVLADAHLRARDRRRRVGRLRQRGPDVLGDRAGLRDARVSPSGSSPAWWRAPSGCAWATRLSWDTEIGPMVSRRADARSCGGWSTTRWRPGPSLHCGGPVEAPAGLDGAFYAPAVLTGVTREMRIMREEIFGPAVPIVVVDSADEAVALANDSDFGLGASVWTSDRVRGERIAGELQSGMVWINDHMFSHGACQCAWGGVKDSGLGRTHSKFGLYECVNVKLRTWEGSARARPVVAPVRRDAGRGVPRHREAAVRTRVRPRRRAA